MNARTAGTTNDKEFELSKKLFTGPTPSGGKEIGSSSSSQQGESLSYPPHLASPSRRPLHKSSI